MEKYTYKDQHRPPNHGRFQRFGVTPEIEVLHFVYYTSSLDCAPLFERAHDSEKVLVPLQPALQSFATTVPDKECIRHVQPHHVFTGQQCRNARFCSVAAPQSIKKCGSCCSMFTLPPPAPAITLLCTSCMPLVRARVFRAPPSVQRHRQPCSCASRKSVVIVKYPALAPRVLASATVPRKVPCPSTRRPSERQATDSAATQKT